MNAASEVKLFAKSAHLALLLFFLMISYIYFGRGLFSSEYAIYGTGSDPLQYLWFFKWWAYAINHGVHPLMTQKIWPPQGYNIAGATSVLGVWLLSLPLQIFMSAQTAMNVLAVLTPGLAGWTMCLFTNTLMGQRLPSVFAGLLFGFSGYMVAQMLGHLNLTAGIFIIPLLALLILKFIRHDVSAKSFVISYALLATLFFLISKELAYIFLLAVVIAVPLSKSILKWDKALWQVFGWMLAAYIVSALLLAPYIYYFVFHSTVGDIGGGGHGNDVLGLIVPTKIFAISSAFTHDVSEGFKLNPVEQNGYLSLPLVLICVWYFRKHWREEKAKLLGIGMLLPLVVSLGDGFFFAGHKLMNDPLVHGLALYFPMLSSVTLSRFALFTAFSSALVVAYLLKNQEYRQRKLCLVLLAIVCLMPHLNSAFYPRYTQVNPPEFFQSELYEDYLHPDDHVLILAKNQGEGLYYQSLTDFYFTLANGYVGRHPVMFSQDIMNAIATNQVEHLKKEDLEALIEKQNIRLILLTEDVVVTWLPLLKSMSMFPREVGGVYLAMPPKNINEVLLV